MSLSPQASAAPEQGYNFAYLDEQTKRMIRRGLLKAVAIPGYQVPFGGREMPLPYGWGTGGMQVTAAILGADDVLKVIDQGADDTTNAVSIRRFFARTAGVATTERTPEATVIQTRHRIPETALSGEQIMVYQVPIPEPLRFIEPSEAETRTMHALNDYGVMHVKLYEDIATFGHIATSYAYPVTVDERYVMDPSPIPKFDNPKLDMNPALMLFGAGREKRLYAVPPFTRVASLDFEDHPFEVQRWEESCAFCGSHESYLDELIVDDRGGKRFVCSDTDYCTQRRARQEEGGRAMNAVCESIDASLDARDRPLLSVRGLTRLYGPEKGCQEVDFDLYPGEVLGIVGESGSGKSTLLSLLSGRCPPDAGTVAYRDDGDRWLDLYAASEAERRTLLRTEWGFVEQNPRDGLRMGVSAGANIGERLMAQGVRHYGRLRQAGLDWLEQVEIDPLRIDDLPRTFSGGMQQRLQIARNLVSAPRLVFMDEPTGGLDVSVQARLLDLLRGLVRELDLAVVIVTHDLAVARLLADRLMVMRRSRVVEAGLTDQILDDPQHPYTQLLVSSVLQP